MATHFRESKVLINPHQNPVDPEKGCRPMTCILPGLFILKGLQEPNFAFPRRSDTRSGCIICESSRRLIGDQWIQKDLDIEVGASELFNWDNYHTDSDVPPLYVTPHDSNFEITYVAYEEEFSCHDDYYKYGKTIAHSFFKTNHQCSVLIVIINNQSMCLFTRSLRCPPVQYWYFLQHPFVGKLLPDFFPRFEITDLTERLRYDSIAINRIGEFLDIDGYGLVCYCKNKNALKEIQPLFAEINNNLNSTDEDIPIPDVRILDVIHSALTRQPINDLVLIEEQLSKCITIHTDIIPVIWHEGSQNCVSIRFFTKCSFLWMCYYLIAKDRFTSTSPVIQEIMGESDQLLLADLFDLKMYIPVRDSR